uniref:Uncharacterized protein n=1 Tax=Arundo donax TaxID=35708 RepID=A0A0A9FG78_ARUDO
MLCYCMNFFACKSDFEPMLCGTTFLYLLLSKASVMIQETKKML